MILIELNISWNKEKNERLKKERSTSFEEVAELMQKGHVIDDYPHPNRKRYPNQRVSVVLVNNYIYAVPYVDDGKIIFLKTIIPSRKLTKKYKVFMKEVT